MVQFFKSYFETIVELFSELDFLHDVSGLGKNLIQILVELSLNWVLGLLLNNLLESWGVLDDRSIKQVLFLLLELLVLLKKLGASMLMLLKNSVFVLFSLVDS